MPTDWHRHPLIDHVVIGINAVFPLSDSVVVALQGIAKGAPHWPHIDPTGNVCLGRLRYSSPAATRVLSTLQDALTVFDLPEEKRDAEHRREFLAYWSQLAEPTRTPYFCVMDGVKNSRDIVYYSDPRHGAFFAEDAAQLNTWLARIGTQPPKVRLCSNRYWN